MVDVLRFLLRPAPDLALWLIIGGLGAAAIAAGMGRLRTARPVPPSRRSAIVVRFGLALAAEALLYFVAWIVWSDPDSTSVPWTTIATVGAGMTSIAAVFLRSLLALYRASAPASELANER